MKHRRFGIAMAITTALSWGTLAIALKYALNFASSGTIAQFRFVVAAAIVGFILPFKQFKKIPFGSLSVALFSSVFLAFNYFAFMKGVEHTSASHTQILIQVGPLFLLLSGVFLFRESFSWIQGFGLLQTVIGFLLFFIGQRQVLPDAEFTPEFWLGSMWIFLAGVAWALFAGIQKKLVQTVDALSLNACTYLMCALVLIPVSDFSEWGEFSIGQWLFISALGANTVVAYGCLNLALKHAPAADVSMIITCNPILTLVLMNFLYHWKVNWVTPEPQTLIGWLGALLVISGILFSQFKGKPRPS